MFADGLGSDSFSKLFLVLEEREDVAKDHLELVHILLNIAGLLGLITSSCCLSFRFGLFDAPMGTRGSSWSYLPRYCHLLPRLGILYFGLGHFLRSFPSVMSCKS